MSKTSHKVLIAIGTFFFFSPNNFAMDPEKHSILGKRVGNNNLEFPPTKRQKVDEIKKQRETFEDLVDHEDTRGIDQFLNNHPDFINDEIVTNYIWPTAQKAGYTHVNELTLFIRLRLLGTFLDNTQICRINKLSLDILTNIFSLYISSFPAKSNKWKDLNIVCREWQHLVDTSIVDLVIKRPPGEIKPDKPLKINFERFSGIKSLQLYVGVDRLNALPRLETLEFYKFNSPLIDPTCLTNLTTLRLSGAANILSSVSSYDGLQNFLKFPKLTTLNLAGDSIKLFSESLANNYNPASLTNLTSLDLRECECGTQDNQIQHLTTLKSLYLKTESISDKGISLLTNLQTLSLTCTGRANITDAGIRPLTNLVTLIIQNEFGGGHRVNITGQSIRELTNLTQLNLAYNEFVTIDDLKHLSKLQHLHFPFYEIREIAPSLPNLLSMNGTRFFGL